MDTVTREKHERKWARVIGESLDSDLSIENFCKKRGICEQTYYRWRKQLKGKFDMHTGEEYGMQATGNGVEEVRFIRVQMPGQAAEAGTDEAPVILYAGSAAIRIHETASEELLTRLLRAVNHAG